MKLAEALAGAKLDPAQIGVVQWPTRPLWRVYSNVFAAAGFNRTAKGNARFSPVEYAGAVVPTLYGATTVAAALMETVLHDAPSPSAGYILTLDPMTEPRRLAQLHTTARLQLADLTAVGLRRLGLARPDVIDSGKTHYPITRRLAEWVYAQRSDVQGLLWTSRQDDTAQALVLFEPRLPKAVLRVVLQGEPITSGPHHDTLVELLGRLGSGLHLAP